MDNITKNKSINTNKNTTRMEITGIEIELKEKFKEVCTNNNIKMRVAFINFMKEYITNHG